MHRINNMITGIAFLLLAMITAAGCLEKEDMAAGMQSVMIELSISAEPQTKSDPTSSESAISSLRIYAFQGERLAGYVARMNGVSEASSLYMDLELPVSGQHQVDFYVVANEAQMAYENGVVTLSENMTRTQLEAVRFTGLNSASALPMYGKLSETIDVDKIRTLANDQTGHEGHFMLVDPVNIHLMRSLAKISVYAAKASGAATVPQILSVDLLGAGTRVYSYLFPQTETVLDNIPSRANDRSLISSGVSVTGTVESGTSAALDPLNYTPVATGLYLPEVSAGFSIDDPSYSWNTASGDSGAAVLRVGYTLAPGSEMQSRDIYLPRVERNNHIKVCMLINASGHIMINYSVAEWDWDEDRMLDWFFDYPTHTYIWHMLPKTETDLSQKPDSPAVMSETRPFTGYFQMTYPDNDKWTPTLEGLKASYCSIKVYNTRTGAEVFSSDSPVPLSVSEDWYRLEVYPKPAYMEPGDNVNLVITYTPSGFTESEYLLINGSHPDYFWPGSTSENYVTITMVN